MNQASPADEPLSAETAVPAAKSRLPLVIVMTLLLAGVGGGTWWFMKSKAPANSKEETTTTTAKAHYAPLEPAFVVNLSQDEINRYLQIALQVMAHSEAALETLTDHDPLIRNRLLLLFSTQRFDQISTREGKEALQSKALEEIRSVLKEAGEPAEIEAVYFTSFVMQ